MKKWTGAMTLILISVLLVGCVSGGGLILPFSKKDSNTIKIKEIEVTDVEEENAEVENGENISNNSKEGNLLFRKEEGERINSNNKQVDEEKVGSNNQNKGQQVETSKEDNTPSTKYKIHYSGDNSRRQVALTFDDGPDGQFTPEILDILKEYNIKATFFVIGINAEKHPDVLKRISEEGHIIANHSWSHKNFTKISVAQMEQQILKTKEVVEKITGAYSPFIRPPYGALGPEGKKLSNSLGQHIVNWSVDTRDWAGPSTEEMLATINKQLKPGGIILMHSAGNPKTIQNTVTALPEIIEMLMEQGYEFVTVPQILNIN